MAYKGKIPSVLNKANFGEYSLFVESDGFLSVKKVSVKHNLTTSIDIKMISIEEIKNRLSILESRRKLFTIVGSILIGTGGYLRYSADKDYEKYLVETKEATNLHKQIKMKDSIGT